MLQQVIRIRELASTATKQGKLPVSRATVWRWVREGKFPKPYKLGKSVTVWNVDEVDAFLAQCAGDPSHTAIGDHAAKAKNS